MKKIKIFSLILSLLLLAGALTPAALADEQELSAPELRSAAAIIIDCSTGRPLYAYNADERREPASLTKIMTALLAIEAAERGEVSLDDNVTAGDEALQGMVENGSTADIQVGETMTLRDLLYCAMLSSANEACNIIAVYVAGSLDAFVEDMNNRAAEIGCTGTHFANTHGLPDSDHYTTARDFAMICQEAMSNEVFYSMSGTVSYTVPATNMSAERQLSNSNGLINPETTVYPGNYYEYARAGKTGHTTAAGYCLASLAERDGIRLIAVVLGGEYTQDDDGSYIYTNFTDSRTLYTWVYDNFSMQEVLSSTEIVTSATVALAEDNGRASLRPQQSITALLPNTGFDTSTLERDIELYSDSNGEELVAPIAAGSVLGVVTVSLDGYVLGSSSLVTSGTVELARSEYMKQEIAGFFSNIWVEIILIVLVAAVALYIASVVRYRKLHKRHLQSLEQAEERIARRRAEEEEEYYSQVAQSVQRPAAVSRPVPVSDENEIIDEKTTVLTGLGRQSAQAASATRDEPVQRTAVPRSGVTPLRPTVQNTESAQPPRRPVNRPGDTSQPQRRSAPAASQRPTPPPARQTPSAPRQAPLPRTGSAGAPTNDKARRDYFEEFFRNNGTNNRDSSDKQ